LFDEISAAAAAAAAAAAVFNYIVPACHFRNRSKCFHVEV